jgi:hypothetical protein
LLEGGKLRRHLHLGIIQKLVNGQYLHTWVVFIPAWGVIKASARREDGRPDGGDVLELAARIDGDKAEVLSQAAKEMVREARRELESAARSGIQPPTWVRAIMSQAGHEHYHHILQHHNDQVHVCTIQPPDHDQEHTGGVVGLYTGTLQELETIRDYGQAHEWAALVIDGEEIVPAGRR